MSPESEPTPWELMRLLRKIDERLEGLESRLVPMQVFQAEQEQTRQRFHDLATDLSEWKAESRASHAELGARITTQADRATDLERSSRESRARTWLAVGVAVLGALLSIGAGLVLQAMGGS